MREHEFTVVLTEDPNEDEAERLYGSFDDGTLSTLAGVPQVRFHRKAASLKDAIRSAIANIRAAGCDVERGHARRTAAERTARESFRKRKLKQARGRSARGLPDLPR